MKTILHLSASARGEDSASYRLSRQTVAQLLERHAQARMVRRDLSAEPLPHVDSLYASTLARLPGGAAHPQGRSSLEWSDLLIEELKAADVVVIATPRSGDRARQPDFLEPYLRAILPTIGLKDLRFLD